jgi:ABC-2 type transport system ATP-binding protein
MNTPAIELHKLSKHYPNRSEFALKDLSLQVMPGEVYGFLGANGAGKSTTIRTLLNFLQPTSGRAKILGRDVVTDSVNTKRHVGYLSGEIALYPKATAGRLFEYLNALHASRTTDYTAELAKRFSAILNKPMGNLSKGERQKIGIIQAFMHEPDVLILDEPTGGLDPLMQEEFFKLVAETKARGAAIFFSSHNLAEAQRICDRVGIIKHGRLIHEQTVRGDSQLGRPVFHIILKDAGENKTLGQAKTFKVLSSSGQAISVQPTDTIAAALAELSHFDIVSFETETLKLEDEFMEFYGDNK